MSSESFASRHIGPRGADIQEMLTAIGYNSMDQLVDQTVPSQIRLKNPLKVDSALTEQAYLQMLRNKASQNRVYRNFIGMGYYPTVIPSPILRNILENPGWYTAYTPYQAEIAQGRLEALLNFQTVVSDLTGLEIANASLLDEGTALAEAMIMFYNHRSRAKAKAGANKFFVDHEIFPQTHSVMAARAEPLGIELVAGDWKTHDLDESYFGSALQYPNNSGAIEDYAAFTEKAHGIEVLVAVATDLMALALITPPGEWGADAAVGNSQRFGVPMGYGGPHAAFFATRESFKRHIPGRIIGVSKDRLGKQGYRMALQTREQHIRRDKATSNICTAQALLAVMASMYAVYHGPAGIKNIASSIHKRTSQLAELLEKKGYSPVHNHFFDTIRVAVTNQDVVKERALDHEANLRYFDDDSVGISMYEGIEAVDVADLVWMITGELVTENEIPAEPKQRLGNDRKTEFLTHQVFNTYRSETELMRYIKRLENRDLSLTHSMIPLGSCTMKLNAASELMPLSWPEFSEIHPFTPKDQCSGYQEMLDELSRDLCVITGFDGMSLQPNSGAQGEYAGLLVIRAYHQSRGEGHRDICLIPSSAHGTNPASAVMAGMKVVVVKCDDMGNVDLDDLKTKAELHADNLSAFMITYPSTHGVFEELIIEINEIIHTHGGQVYMDGANMNAQVGLTSPGNIGADVCHLNLHKTFAIPHGGGGPGMGPIGVRAHLIPFLPGNPVIETGGDQAIDAVSSAPYGSSLILLISYGYIKMLGGKGITDATRFAILNANYLRARFEKSFDILYKGKNGTVAHEMILDCRSFKHSAGIEVEDIAKRLIDYGFHAPTVSFPVAGTLMIEPTESESKEELDRFAEALLSIRNEISLIENGTADKEDNVLKMAPHTAEEATSDDWSHPYSRSQAVYPLPWLKAAKFWSAVGRVDNAYGDRNLVCTCPPISSFELEMLEDE